MINKKFIIIITSYFFMPSLNASASEPIFSGIFYVNATSQSFDNCAIDQFSYEASGGTPGAMALDYLNTNHHYSTCNWIIATAGQSSVQDMPPDFPGNAEAWSTAMNQSPSGVDWAVDADCITPSHQIQTKFSVPIYPKYTCQQPSRNGIDSTTGLVGCTTTPALCQGDVVGRDLDSTVSLDNVGHVGLTNSTNMITQVMNNSILIDDVSFDSFKAATSYWGDKYGLPGLPIYSIQQGQLILNAETSQQGAFGTYELEPIFVPLQTSLISVYNSTTQTWQQQVSTSYPLFRCDTFVDWVYFIGLGQAPILFHDIAPVDGYKAYEYNDYTATPYTLFNTLTTTRMNGLDINYSSPSFNQNSNSSTLKIAQETAYLTDSSIDQRNKIQKYWLQYQNGNNLQKELAFDGLLLLTPTELIPNLIKNFYADPNDQVATLKLILAGMQANPENTPAIEISSLLTGQTFLETQVQQQTNPQLLQIALYGYISATPYSIEKANLVNQAIQRLAELEHVDPQSFYRLQFLLDINDLSGNSLNHLIGSIKNSTYASQFTQFLTDQIQTGLIASQLSSMNQSQISSYMLQEIQQSLTQSNNSYFEAMDSADIQNYTLLKAYGAFLEQPDFLANAILTTQDPDIQAGLIMLALADPQAVHTQVILKADRQILIRHLSQGQNPSGNSVSVMQTSLPLRVQTAINTLASA